MNRDAPGGSAFNAQFAAERQAHPEHHSQQHDGQRSQQQIIRFAAAAHGRPGR